MLRVSFKQRAFIGGRTYDGGEEGLIDKSDFHESVHTLLEDLDAPAPEPAPTTKEKSK